MTATGWMYLAAVLLVCVVVFTEPAAETIRRRWARSRPVALPPVTTRPLIRPAAPALPPPVDEIDASDDGQAHVDAFDAIAAANPDLAAIDIRTLTKFYLIPGETP